MYDILYKYGLISVNVQHGDMITYDATSHYHVAGHVAAEVKFICSKSQIDSMVSILAEHEKSAEQRARHPDLQDAWEQYKILSKLYN